MRLTLIAVFYLAIFILLDLVTKQFSELPGIVAWYPPAGLTYALLLVLGVGFTPAVTIALLCDSILIYRMPQSPLLLFLWALIISLVYGAAVLFLRKRIHLDWRLQKLRDVTWFVLTTAVVSALLAVLSVGSSALSGGIPRSEIALQIFHWWIGETVGILTITPFLLIYVMPGLKRFMEGEPIKFPAQRSFPRVTLSALGQAASIALMLYWVFLAPVPAQFRPLFLIALPLIWIALQRGFKGIATALLVVNSGVVIMLVLFRFDLTQLEELQLTMIISSIMCLLMGAIVTEQKLMTENLRESEANYHQLVENSPDNIVRFDLDGRLLLVNRPVREGLEMVMGGKENKFLGKTYRELGFPEEQVKYWDDCRLKVIDTGLPFETEYTFEIFGDVRFYEWRLFPELDQDGRVATVLAISRDITERKQAEDKLRHSNEDNYRILNSMAEGTYGVDTNGFCTYVNRAFLQILGYQDEHELLGKHIHELIHHSHPDGSPYPSSECKMYHVYETHQPITVIDEVFWRKDGVAIPVEYWSYPIVKDNVVIGSIATFFDITERKRNEEQIEILSKIPSESPNPIMRVTKRGSLLYANPMSEPLLSKWKTQIGKRLPIDLRGKIQKVFGTGKYQEVEVQTKEKVYSLILAPIVDAGYVNLYGRDITLRKQAEESSRHHLKDLEMLYENSLRINSFLNAEEIGRQVIDSIIRKGLSWRHVAVFLFHQEKQQVEMLVNSYPGIKTEKVQAEKLRLTNLVTNPNEGLVGWVIQNGRPIRDGNVNKDKRYIMAYPDIRSGIYVPMVVGDRVIGVISVESEQTDAYTKADERLLLTISAQASVAMENARLFSEIENSHLNLTLAYDETIEGWSKALDFRDKETEGHSKRVTELSWKLARGLGLNRTELLNIRWGALLHDIGKMGIPDAILLKPSSLTNLEWMIMKKHTTFAFEWLSPIAYLQKALDIPYCHHEKWDGTGYPRGLKGEEIPLPARLFAVVDVYDALISDRPYRKAWTKAKALEYIEEQKGKHFDPKIVSKFKTIIEKINKSESG